MCTMIAEKREVAGAGTGAQGWCGLDHVYVTYDHPFELRQEHALNIDFVNEAAGPGARVAVELTRESAEALVEAIQGALRRAAEVE